MSYLIERRLKKAENELAKKKFERDSAKRAFEAEFDHLDDDDMVKFCRTLYQGIIEEYPGLPPMEESPYCMIPKVLWPADGVRWDSLDDACLDLYFDQVKSLTEDLDFFMAVFPREQQERFIAVLDDLSERLAGADMPDAANELKAAKIHLCEIMGKAES